ncbi:TetR/AcrR family transcriptional regulator [Nocardia jinanensis]|uniref:TetR family transcriptional regulator n=1 Tax=Nocardia jinanensis TaxID=382504 RepID=A0A917RJL2_9NOCA|nr:TetR/AcrR family transcriptional regulator [Nocardia jinanensis]GGL10249.1 TetR family transcriptional regulator [Nocardia jinanensis]
MARKSRAQPVADDAQSAESKSARTRQRILDAAAHVLSVKGYSGTRLSDVAEYAELQAPAIYYYFGSREDLIEEVMWSGVAEMRRHVEEVLEQVSSDVSPLDRILVAVEAHLRHELELSDYATAAIRNSGQVPDHIRARQMAEDANYGAIWRRLIKDADAEKQLRTDMDLPIAQMLIMGSLNWAAEWWTPRRGSLETVIRTAQSMIRHGIGAPDAGSEHTTRRNRSPRHTGRGVKA